MNKKADAYVKLVDAYVDKAFMLCRVAEAIRDGEVFQEDKVAALLRDVNLLSDRIKELTGRRPLDVKTEFTLGNIRYDGERVQNPVEEVRRVVRDALFRPADLVMYEQAVILYYASKHKMCVDAAAEQVA